MLAANRIQNQDPQMPRACAVECSRLTLHSCEREASTAQGRGIQARFFQAGV
jgi:hypothetical protein